MLLIDSQRRAYRPKTFWYLQALGVDPCCQNRGVGTSLIAPVLRMADSEHMPCYLETDIERNVAFYEKSGFHVLAQLEIQGAPLRLWTMHRLPNGKSVGCRLTAHQWPPKPP
jgi:ribosomal protein S18 acetylase RimI-like enzyme